MNTLIHLSASLDPDEDLSALRADLAAAGLDGAVSFHDTRLAGCWGVAIRVEVRTSDLPAAVVALGDWLTEP